MAFSGYICMNRSELSVKSSLTMPLLSLQMHLSKHPWLFALNTGRPDRRINNYFLEFSLNVVFPFATLCARSDSSHVLLVIERYIHTALQ